MSSAPHSVLLVSLSLHTPGGTLGTVTVAPRSLNAHPKKMKLGSSNCLKFTEMVNYFIITLVLYHFNIFCDPITRSFLAPAGVGAQSAHSFCQNWAVSFKVLHALCMLTIVMQGQANLNVCTNWLAGLNYYRLSRTKMITMQLRCAFSENAN